MIGFGVLTLIYYVAILAAWFVALVGGMFLQRAGFRQPFDKNPSYAMLALAVLLGLVMAIANPSAHFGFVSTATAIFTGFIGALIGIAIVAGIGYLLSPERVSKYYERTQHWLNNNKVITKPQSASSEHKISGDEPETPPASEERKP